MRKYGLLLLTIVLCAAAGAIMTAAILAQNSLAGHREQEHPAAENAESDPREAKDAAEEASTAPSNYGGNVEACFLSSSLYEKQLSGKERYDFDPSCIAFEGQSIPYDRKTNTAYIPQSCEDSGWEGTLTTGIADSRICILNDAADEKAACIEEGRILKLAVVSDGKYMESDLVFTGLPVVCMGNNEGVIEGEEEYRGTLTVMDPNREEYQGSACTFHVRGATSLLFDKKSFRVELQQTAGESDKKSFLGMRRDDDWILNSMCTDKSLAREKVCYDLWKKLNSMQERPVASSEVKYCELLINNEYMGVYGLMFPVDKKLMNMKPGDLLYKVGTWYEEISIPGELTDYNGQLEILNRNGVAYLKLKYPKDEGNACIYDPFQLYQEMVFETGNMDEMNEAGISLNMENFILHELFCEMTRAGDNTWKNMFIAAYRDQNGGYTLNETIWDMNYTFGDDFTWDPDNGNTVFDPDTTDSYEVRYDRDYGYVALAHIVDGLREDTAVKWRLWRSRGISAQYIQDLFKDNREYLAKTGAFKRNALRWDLDEQEKAYSGIDEWVEGRFKFLDEMYGYSSEQKAE